MNCSYCTLFHSLALSVPYSTGHLSLSLPIQSCTPVYIHQCWDRLSKIACTRMHTCCGQLQRAKCVNVHYAFLNSVGCMHAALQWPLVVPIQPIDLSVRPYKTVTTQSVTLAATSLTESMCVCVSKREWVQYGVTHTGVCEFVCTGSLWSCVYMLSLYVCGDWIASSTMALSFTVYQWGLEY